MMPAEKIVPKIQQRVHALESSAYLKLKIVSAARLPKCHNGRCASNSRKGQVEICGALIKVRVNQIDVALKTRVPLVIGAGCAG
jgi:hypothetical protein